MLQRYYQVNAEKMPPLSVAKAVKVQWIEYKAANYCSNCVNVLFSSDISGFNAFSRVLRSKHVHVLTWSLTWTPPRLNPDTSDRQTTTASSERELLPIKREETQTYRQVRGALKVCCSPSRSGARVWAGPDGRRFRLVSITIRQSGQAMRILARDQRETKGLNPAVWVWWQTPVI